MSTEILLSVK